MPRPSFLTGAAAGGGPMEPIIFIADTKCRLCKVRCGYDEEDPDLCTGDKAMLLCCNCARLKGWGQNTYVPERVTRAYRKVVEFWYGPRTWAAPRLWEQLACRQCKDRWPEVERQENERLRAQQGKLKLMKPDGCLDACLNPSKHIHHRKCPNYKTVEEIEEIRLEEEEEQARLEEARRKREEAEDAADDERGEDAVATKAERRLTDDQRALARTMSQEKSEKKRQREMQKKHAEAMGRSNSLSSTM